MVDCRSRSNEEDISPRAVADARSENNAFSVDAGTSILDRSLEDVTAFPLSQILLKTVVSSKVASAFGTDSQF